MATSVRPATRFGDVPASPKQRDTDSVVNGIQRVLMRP